MINFKLNITILIFFLSNWGKIFIFCLEWGPDEQGKSVWEDRSGSVVEFSARLEIEVVFAPLTICVHTGC